jgi:hypothetical protein
MKTKMEYTKEELLRKMLHQIEMLLLAVDSKLITEKEFINLITYLKNRYENEIH